MEQNRGKPTRELQYFAAPLSKAPDRRRKQGFRIPLQMDYIQVYPVCFAQNFQTLGVFRTID
jgi:hypothetical protein